MKSFQQLLIDRRSIRRYTQQTIEPEKVRSILEAALLSPTSKSKRAWHFIVIEDTEMLLKLAECKPLGQTSIGRARLAIVVAEDTTLTEAWIEDASVAASNMMLQARELGIGSCWVQVNGRFTADGTPSGHYIQQLLGMPEPVLPLCIITLGYPDEQRKPQDTDKLLWERVHIGQWD